MYSFNLRNLISHLKKYTNSKKISWKDSFLDFNPPEKVEADFSLSLAVLIANKYKISPAQEANNLIESTIFNFSSFLSWKVTEQGYINFTFRNNTLQNFLINVFDSEGKSLLGEKKNFLVNIEFVSANPTGLLHLAHFRQAFIGESLARVYEFSGYQVEREYYINDRGKQIKDLIYSIYFFYHYLQGKEIELPAPFFENISYNNITTKELAKEIISNFGTSLVFTNLLLGEIFLKWKKIVLELVLGKIKEELEYCGIFFDRWTSENNFYEIGLQEKLLFSLREKNLIYFKDGSTFFFSSLDSDEKDRVIIKDDGDYTYFFSDIIYHQDKFSRADLLLVILGADHHGFLPRLRSAISLMGYESSKLKFILVQMIHLINEEKKTERFSKRAGNTISLSEALNYLSLDELKFFLIEKENNQHLFISLNSLQESKKETKLFYLQYAHARCCQLLKKAFESKVHFNFSREVFLLEKQIEKKIIKNLFLFPLLLDKIIDENKPHHLIHYLNNLAQLWQNYYQNNVILQENYLELTSQRLLLVKNIQIILKIGLNLIGVNSPEYM